MLAKLRTGITEIFRSEPFPHEAEAFRRAFFDVMKTGEGTYEVWNLWGSSRYALGAIKLSEIGARYVPYTPHKNFPEYNAVLEKARELGLKTQ